MCTCQLATANFPALSVRQLQVKLLLPPVSVTDQGSALLHQAVCLSAFLGVFWLLEEALCGHMNLCGVSQMVVWVVTGVRA